MIARRGWDGHHAAGPNPIGRLEKTSSEFSRYAEGAYATGRKLAVDCYGPVAHIDGGALSGKDCTKTDRSGARMHALNEIHHENRAHASLGASSSHRWLMCPPSVRLSEHFEERPSVYAEEGTFLHELCELKLHRYLGDMTREVIDRQYEEHRDNDFYSDEAETVTDEYVNFCIETIEATRLSCPDPLIMVEHRLDYSEYVPEGFGTGDLVIVADGVIEVIDFKSGRGVRVDADHNSQLMLYGLGALLEFDPLYDIHTVCMTIVQPRLSNTSTFEMAANALIEWAEKEVLPKALLAYERKGEFCAGEWCRFCKARVTCRKRSEYHMQLAERDFKQPDLLTDEEIAEILPVADSLTHWVEDILAYATQQAVDGKSWQGYKLVAGRSVRRYTSEADVIRACEEAGFTDIYKTSLLGVGDLEKRMGRKKFAEPLGKYILKPTGAPTLVPESEWELYALDQAINNRGVRVDKRLVKQAMRIDEAFSEAAYQRAKELTGLENPGSVSQLKAWLADQDIPMESLA